MAARPGESALSDGAETDSAVASFRSVCRLLDVAADFDDFVVGPLRSLTQADVGPDNCIVTEDGVKLVDFELAAQDHPLKDAAHWRLGFPCCGCAGAIPAELLDRMDAAHGTTLVQRSGVTGPGEGEAVRARAVWLCNRIVRLVDWDALDEDWQWGRVGGRQRMLALLAEFESAEFLPDFTETIRRLEHRLRARWPDVPDFLPTYPALV